MTITRLVALQWIGWAFAAGWAPAAPAGPLIPGAAPAMSCESLTGLALPNTHIDSAVVVDAGLATAWCRATAIVSYPTGDRFTVWVGLPIGHWNGRFEGLGGGGFMAGDPNSLGPQVADGYAAAATDAGIQRSGGPGSKPFPMDGSFALDAAGHMNFGLIRDFAHRGVHEMTVTGKAVTEKFYGRAAPRAYFNGCSTGGRQGQMEAQRYPDDYDGILSGAPAVNWTKLHVAQLWGEFVMAQAHDVVAPCKLAAATAAAIAACDAADGVKDGLIGAPESCHYDPAPLVGTSAGACGTITAADAAVIRKIWEGPRRRNGDFLWYGSPRGADLAALNGSRDDRLTPMPITLDWWRLFLKQDPDWDWRTLTPETYELLFDQSVDEYPVIATDDPDLSAFSRHGGKTILWHGGADQLIYPQGTIDYFQRVQARAGGAAAADGFARLFLAPGVAHCAGGDGPQPTGQLEALVSWVEQGKRPAMLAALTRDKDGKIVRSRPLCPYPEHALYSGSGSTDEAKNFHCGR